MNFIFRKKRIMLSLVLLISVLISQDTGESSASGSGTTGSIGTVTINGQVYNQLSLRPEFPIGNLGIGLDLYLYFNDSGMYWDSWKFSSAESIYRTIIDKLYYLRWGRPGDDLYIMAGALPSVTLGNGILVSNYSNIMEYPQVRQVGLNIQAKYLGFGLEIIHSNFKTIDPGIMAFRASREIISNLSIGISAALDNNQLGGLPDSDGDNYPDYYDFYPDDSTQYDGMAEALKQWTSLEPYLASSAKTAFNSWFENSSYFNEYNPETADKDPISGYSIDLTYKINENTSIYSQGAMLSGSTLEPETGETTNLGIGMVPIGFLAKLGPVQLVGEYRTSSRNFMFSYWDKAYDISRVSVLDSGIDTKEYLLYQYGKQNGLFTQLDISFMNIFDFVLGYQSMKGEKWDSLKEEYVNEQPNQTLLSTLALNPSKIPKLGKAEAFYQQTNVSNPFEFEPDLNTIYGYDLGLEMSSGVMLVYKSRTTYMIDLENNGDLKPVNSIQIETQFIF